MVDHRTVKLGKHAPIAWPLKTAKFFTSKLAAPPPSFANSRGIEGFGMMLNGPNGYPNPSIGQGLGCCVIADAFHRLQTIIMSQIDPLIEQFLIHTIMPSDNVILRYYSEWAGYKFDQPNTDNGMAIVDRLKLEMQQGLAGYKLLGFVDPAPSNLLHVKQSIAFFGGLDIGILLPVAWQNMEVWDVVPGDQPGTWGGHAVWAVDYDKVGLWVITWGYLQRITWAGFQWVCDECHTVVSADFKPRVGFDLVGLRAALEDVQG